jgi:hypothetical protein
VPANCRHGLFHYHSDHRQDNRVPFGRITSNLKFVLCLQIVAVVFLPPFEGKRKHYFQIKVNGSAAIRGMTIWSPSLILPQGRKLDKSSQTQQILVPSRPCGLKKLFPTFAMKSPSRSVNGH